MQGVTDEMRSESAPGGATVVLAIEGMHCGSCSALIEETLLEDLGVTAASVDLAAARATVTYDPAQHSVGDLCDAVAAAGYVAKAQRIGVAWQHRRFAKLLVSIYDNV